GPRELGGCAFWFYLGASECACRHRRTTTTARGRPAAVLSIAPAITANADVSVRAAEIALHSHLSKSCRSGSRDRCGHRVRMDWQQLAHDRAPMKSSAQALTKHSRLAVALSFPQSYPATLRKFHASGGPLVPQAGNQKIRFQSV